MDQIARKRGKSRRELAEESWNLMTKNLAICLKLAGRDVESFCDSLKGHYSKTEERVERAADQVWSEGSRWTALVLPNVLARWHNDRDYVDDQGEPMAIPREGACPSLEHLLGRAYVDEDVEDPEISMEEIMKALTEADCVEMTAEGKIVPKESYYRYRGHSESFHDQLALNMAEFLSTMAHNTLVHAGVGADGDESRFQRVASHRRFPRSEFWRLEQLAREHGMQLLHETDAIVMEDYEDVGEESHAGAGFYIFRMD